jgi:hypothetical protein
LEDGEDVYLMTSGEIGHYLLKQIVLVEGPPCE